MIYLEKNPQALKMYPDNRKINRSHVTKISKSMREKNLLKDLPILIKKENDGFYVIDGQHRLSAALLIGADVWCKEVSNMSRDDIARINSINRKWSKEMYLDHFCKNGNKEYIKFKKYSDAAKAIGIGFGVAGKILMSNFYLQDQGSLQSSQSTFIKLEKEWKTKEQTWAVFEAGAFKYPDCDEYAWSYIDEYSEFKKFISSDITNTRSFQLAVQTISFDKEYNTDRMKRQLEKNSNGIKSARDANGYIDQLEAVYNYGISAKMYKRFSRFH